ncbi:MAG: hypothetical protein A3G34_02435 [Candidatus Lindowbacteria bacterium RIFCSPLOWO2_12_FULL_62_27]|nr:MAG: hypothetical protein A3G34_02435 [Candidatus Lindowbacteria bacterium RIFCSPLOWO2_12_FULL_62_27]OGH63810.1 MAG: hypothetical protein A3I06_10825 [Candidatus Lindowbacteria bacterium RIFCSPLOWO2_02_FULL_62_12]
MNAATVARFLDYVRTSGTFDDAKIRKVVHQYRSFDRRMGQLGCFLGYIQPEQINDVLLEQAARDGSFGDCAVRLNLLTPPQISRLANLQKDHLSIFAQAVGIQKALTPLEIFSALDEYVSRHPEALRPADAVTEVDENLRGKVRVALQRVQHIAPLPQTVEKVASMLQDPEVDLDAVAEVLRMDPGLTSSILRLSNSAFYGLRSKIGSIKKALSVVGTTKLRQIVIAAGIMQKFQEIPQDTAARLWEQALRAAECAKELGKYCRIAELDELFVCGLLHNVGEMLIEQYFPEEAGQIRDKRNSKPAQIAAERQLLGGTHADLAGVLLHIWNLPRPTVLSAMFHHHDCNILVHTPGVPDEVFIVHMAATICDLPTGLDAFSYSKALDLISVIYRERLKYPEILDLTTLVAHVDANIEQLDQKYFR